MFIYRSSAIGFLILNWGRRGCKTTLSVHCRFRQKGFKLLIKKRRGFKTTLDEHIINFRQSVSDFSIEEEDGAETTLVHYIIFRQKGLSDSLSQLGNDRVQNYPHSVINFRQMGLWFFNRRRWCKKIKPTPFFIYHFLDKRFTLLFIMAVEKTTHHDDNRVQCKAFIYSSISLL
jgi:hypothetical protein